MIKGITNNFSFMNKGDLSCPMKCSENPPHILNCDKLRGKLNPTETIEATQVESKHIFGSVAEQGRVIFILARLLDIREDLLEEREDSLPVGKHTGPKIFNRPGVAGAVQQSPP